jgi:hypothetical protein
MNFWPPNLYQTPGHIPGAVHGTNGVIYDLMTQYKVANQFVPSVEIMNYEFAKK